MAVTPPRLGACESALLVGGAGLHASSIPAGSGLFCCPKSGAVELEQVLRDAGLTSVRCESFPVTFEFASVDELLGHLGDVSAPIRMILATKTWLDAQEKVARGNGTQRGRTGYLASEHANIRS